jgi:hypothetical protein
MNGRGRHYEDAAAIVRLLFDCNYGRDGRVAIRVRLGHGLCREMAIELMQNGFRRHTADHDPESKVYFQRE